jgi:serine phosphatase RsbU (regulator of sigma subunit)/anti-sigma regulatory factor (Ser/Thr protein kinase)
MASQLSGSAGGDVTFVADLGASPAWRSRDPHGAGRLLAYGMHSMIAAPLYAHGVLTGAITFWRSRGTAPFSHDDLADAGEIAAMTAIALDNARRYDRERTTAVALQRSLLPQHLPSHAAVETAFGYLPADTQVGVGGDWFDVIPLSGARVALVVGDVVGHGIHAAATMGRLRTAMRTLADVDLPPDELLTQLNDVVIHLTGSDQPGTAAAGTAPAELTATCLYAIYNPVSCRCALASAGHPLPFVITPGTTAELVTADPGPPLGIGGLPFETTELDIAPGSVLALYTDGLLHSLRRDIGQALAELRSALSMPAASLEAARDTVIGTMLTSRPDDDVALLLARTRALPPSHVASWDVPADPAQVAHVRRMVTGRLKAWDMATAAFTTTLVASELVTNAIRYGAPPIQLRLIRDTTLICEVSDASGTAPHMRRARSFDEGGRGLLLVAQFTQRWGTRYHAGGKTIWCEQTLTTDPEPLAIPQEPL